MEALEAIEEASQTEEAEDQDSKIEAVEDTALGICPREVTEEVVVASVETEKRKTAKSQLLLNQHHTEAAVEEVEVEVAAEDQNNQWTKQNPVAQTIST